MTTFGDAVAAIADAKRETPALREARAWLAPLRAEAVTALAEFHEVVERLRPVFDAAIAKHNDAHLVGVADPNLRRTLEQALQVIPGGAAGLEGIIYEIDTLTEYAVYQG